MYCALWVAEDPRPCGRSKQHMVFAQSGHLGWPGRMVFAQSAHTLGGQAAAELCLLRIVVWDLLPERWYALCMTSLACRDKLGSAWIISPGEAVA